MLTRIIRDIFENLEYTWTLTNGKIIVPEEDDVQMFLDTAAAKLHDEPEHARLTSGKLIVEKNKSSYDVYVYVGTYK